MHKRKAAVSRRIWTILPRNFANWPAEFGKTYHGKLWTLLIILDVLNTSIMMMMILHCGMPLLSLFSH